MMEQWLKTHLRVKRRDKKGKSLVIDLNDVPKLKDLQKLEETLWPNGIATPPPLPAAEKPDLEHVHTARKKQQRDNKLPRTTSDVTQHDASDAAHSHNQQLTIAAPNTSQPAGAIVQATLQRSPIYNALLANLPLQYENGLYISRSLGVPDSAKKRNFFDPDPDIGVRARLMPIIKFRGNDTGLGNHADYVMGGKSSNDADWRPLIAIFCANKRQQDTIEKRLKSMSPTLMGGYEHVIVTEETQLASGELVGPFIDVEEDHRSVAGAFDPTLPTLCGMTSAVGNAPSTSDSGTYFKIGGLISIGEKVYGLTTAHKISRKDPNRRFTLENEADLDKRDAKGPSDLVAVGHLAAFEYTFPKEYDFRDHSWDWALVAMNTECIRPNLVFSPYAEQDSNPLSQQFPIEGYLPQSAFSFGEVWVAESPNSSILAVLIEQPVLLAFGNNNFEAYSMRLAKPLENGSSGSWVIREGKLCGYIFGRVVGKPWAYMLPIEPVINRISRYFSSKGTAPISVTISVDNRQTSQLSDTQKARVEYADQKLRRHSTADGDDPLATSVQTSNNVTAGLDDISETTASPVREKSLDMPVQPLGRLSDIYTSRVAHPAASSELEEAKSRPSQPKSAKEVVDDSSVRPRIIFNQSPLPTSDFNSHENDVSCFETSERVINVPLSGPSPRLSNSQVGGRDKPLAPQMVRPGTQKSKGPVLGPSALDTTEPTEISNTFAMNLSTSIRVEIPETTPSLVPKYSKDKSKASLRGWSQSANINDSHTSRMVSASIAFDALLDILGNPGQRLVMVRDPVQSLKRRCFAESVIFQDFLLLFSDRFAESFVGARSDRDLQHLVILWHSSPFRRNVNNSMNQAKLDSIIETCCELQQHVERLRLMIESLHSWRLFSINIRELIFSRGATIKKQVDVITECNIRLARLMAYTRPQGVDHANQDTPLV